MTSIQEPTNAIHQISSSSSSFFIIWVCAGVGVCVLVLMLVVDAGVVVGIGEWWMVISWYCLVIAGWWLVVAV